MMKHPFENLSAAATRKVYWLFLALTALSGLITSSLANYPAEGGGKRTVPTVQFEFASTVDAWNVLAADAGPAGLDALRRQTYMDYLFLVCYSTLIAAGIIGVSKGTASGAIRVSARWLAWGQWLAALMDAIENLGLLKNIAGPVSPTWTHVSSVCATIKFALIVAGVLYIYILMARSWRDHSE